MEEAEIRVTKSSGNVFADLGFENPEEELAKAKLVSAMARVIEARHPSRREVAKIIGLDEPSVSMLLRGRTGAYTIDRLLHLLNLLGQDVEISVRPKPDEVDRPAQLSVAVASIL